MTRGFHAKAIINAPVSLVWSTITDIQAYPRIHDGFFRIDGTISLGQNLRIHLKAIPRTSFKVHIKEVVQEEKMVWEYELPPRLLVHVRTFELIAKDDQTTEFHMNEISSGILAGIFANKISHMMRAFSHFSDRLKHFLESRSE